VADAGFGMDTNRVILIDPSGGKQELPLLPKYEVAVHILDRVHALLAQRT
jgi:phosphopantothenoylcysteine synthetase/decarboxylase